MRYYFCFLLLASLLSCGVKNSSPATAPSTLSGTWRLTEAKMIQQGDTIVTFPVAGQTMIKMFNGTHFSFFRHDDNHGKDSINAVYDTGAGTYTFDGKNYHENLDYCNYRGWEGHQFDFTLTVLQDTIIQQGIERIDSLNINREIIEVYARVRL